MHNLLHYPTSELTYLAPSNLEQSAQASCNCNSSCSLSSDDQACHNYNSSDSLGQMTNSSIVVAFRGIITITQMSSFAFVAKWPLLEVSSSLFTSPKLSWPTLVPWLTFSLISYLRLSTMPTRPVLTIGLPYLESKPSATSLALHYLKWTWS